MNGSISVPKEWLLSLLQEMVAIPSINPDLSEDGTGESALADYLAQYMQNHGLEVHTQEPQAGRKNVIGIWRGTGNGHSLMLNGHIDTVGVEGMQIDPFDPILKDGKLYGRGTMDMKSGVAAQIMAVIALKEAGFQPQGDVVIACVADEEFASIGTQELLKEFKTDAAIVTEPTDLHMMVAHKGFVWSKIVVQGHAAHGSRPEVGVDAILHAGKVLVGLSELEEKVFPAIHHPLLGRPSLHASMIQGGSEMSIYPAECIIEVERRTLPGEHMQQVQQELDEILTAIQKQTPNFQAHATAYLERHPLEIDLQTDIVQTFKSAYSDILGHSPHPKGIGFWTDAALLAQAGIPTLLFGPKGKGLHGAIEYVEWESVVQTTQVLAEVIQRCTGSLS